MSKIKVNIIIAGRQYPLTVNSEEEEVALRKAGKLINETIKELESKYHVSDKQDVLAMSVLQIASKLESDNTVNEKTNDKFIHKVSGINKRLDIILQDL